MPRRSHLCLSLLITILLVISFLTSETSSQSTLRSLSLNGTTAYADVANNATLNIIGPITVEAWIKYNAIDGASHDIVSRIDRNQSGSGGGYSITVNPAGKLRLDLFQSHNTYTTVIGATVMSTNAWHHVAGVFDGSQMRVYLDGVLDGSLNTTSGPASGTSLLRIGRAAHATGPPLYLPSYAFAGLIDEVRVSAAALYTSNFTAGLGPGSNVRGLWQFDGQTANDSSGNGNHATLQGGATYSTDVPTVTNNAPTVSLTDPPNNTAFSAGANIVMDATASDNDGSVTKVDFYQGTTLLGTDTTAPYTFVWSNVSPGSYSLTAKATDNASATTTSNAIVIAVVGGSGYHSLSLNGTTAYADVANSATLNITGPITVEAWIKYNAIDGASHDIVSRIDRNQSGSGGGYSITVNPAGKLRLDLFQSHNTYTTVIGATVMSTNAWHHVAGVFDGSQMRVYLDGVLDGSLNTTSGPASGTSLLRIGRAAHATGPPLYLPSYAFAGLIDEVRVSAAALYTSNFTAGLGPGSNVRGLWQFDGQTANDSSGNGNHATLQGGATYSSTVPPTGGSQRPVPVAGGPYSGQPGQAVQLSSNGSFDPDGTIASYHWNFGDGASSNTASPSHIYQVPGFYTATLTVTDNAGLLASVTASVNISGGGDARLEPMNQTGGAGENPLSRNFNWSLPLVNLPGRAGMDLGLTLSYNSLVWTKNVSGNYISFDDDHGFPGPGFRLGFPVLQPPYYNSEAGKNAFLLLSPDGSRTELRQLSASSSLYEAADSSHLLLDTSTMVLRTSDGTQLSYVLLGSEYKCTQIKDRNGNYITINYTVAGRIDTVVDTLARSVKFNYDANGWLTSITQVWNLGTASQVTHNWATFSYADTVIAINFPGITVYGPANNSSIKTLASVTLADGARFDFSYTSWGQVWKVSSYAADNHLINYRAYKLPGSPLLATGPQSDCPRFTERRDWAQYWNGDTDGTAATNEEVVTTFAAPVSDSWTMPDGTAASGTRAQVTAPDGTSNKIYFVGTAGTASGWRRGLPALVNTYDSAGALQRQAMTTWTQDNTAVSYILNPRVTETNIYDPAGNRARTEITYQQFTFANGTSCQLPRDVYEYAANATTKLRSTRTDYHTSANYSDRRIIGLVTEKRLYEGDVNNGGVLMSKVGFFYDNENGATSIQGTDAPVQHDNTNYSASFVTGRGNLSSVKRYDVTNTANFTTTKTKYNTAGAVVSLKDALDHETSIGYVDSFSDGNNTRNTLAYPKTITDPDGFSTTTVYNFDFGAVTRRQTPQPNTTQNLPGPEQSWTFDAIGRLQQITNLVNNAYTRFEYPTSQIRVDTYVTIQEGLGEAHSFRVTDGHGRVIATATDHPGSVGGFSGQRFVYDVMGRVIKTSNPTETNASGAPSQWTSAGDDAAAGWIYTQQTYDWKGRPLQTTHPDTTYSEASYAGCGCAGGEVVTLTDEGTGVKKRQQKIYSDVLGRTVKTEVLNWDGSGPNGTGPGNTVYSTTVTTYNARDQVLQVRQYQGTDSNTTFQDTTITYDGFGRLKTKHKPEEQVDPNNSSSTDHSTWDYNLDDTIQKVTDARGSIASYSYNARHLVSGIDYTAPASIPAAPTVTYLYDAAGNRIFMSDGLGSLSSSYDQLSQLTAETRVFSVGTYTINYSYDLAGKLMSVTDPFGASFTYQRDSQGRLKAVSGSPYAGVTNYVTDMSYRAWGAPKSVTYSDRSSTIAYNGRMQPTQFRLTMNGTGASIMREDYTYSADGRMATLTDLDDTSGNNPPATLRYLSRAYTYDQVGRITQGFGAGGAGVNTPYNQGYTYDAFGNMTGRSGIYYGYNNNPFLSDTATYSNNRRAGWSYYADGQVKATPASSSDNARTMTYDAGGRMISTFESGSNITYAASYDGAGQLVKETSNTSISSETSYILRATALGGEVLTRLDQSGNKKITHVPAEGLLFATQRMIPGLGPDVLATYRNPMGTTETTKAVYDPLGNYIPFQGWHDPRPPAGSYNSGSMAGLSGSQANPESLAVGCVMDGLPTNCSRVMRAVGNGQAKELYVKGFAVTPWLLELQASFIQVKTPRKVPRRLPPTVIYKDENGNPYKAHGLEPKTAIEVSVSYVVAPGGELGFEQNPQNPSAHFDNDTFNRCVDALFGVAHAPSNDGKRVGLAPMSGGIGSYTGFSMLTHTRFTIFTDGQSKDSRQLAIEGGAKPGATAFGYTLDNAPYLNWIASDYVQNPSVSPIFNLANQVHETGNAIAAVIAQKFHGYVKPKPLNPGPFEGDTDSGAALEECVFGGAVFPDGTVRR